MAPFFRTNFVTFFFNLELVHGSVHRKRAPTPHPNSPLRVYEIPYNQGEKCPLSLYRCYPVPTIHHTVAFLRNVRNACYRHPGQMFLNKDSNAYFLKFWKNKIKMFFLTFKDRKHRVKNHAGCCPRYPNTFISLNFFI